MTELDESTVHAIIHLLQNRIDGFWIDLKMGHLQRVTDGIDKKYVDENQALIIVDHLMRLRTYQEVITDLHNRLEKQKSG